MPINNFLLPGAKVTTAYEVANSCRFNDDDNSKMVVTPSSSGTNAGKKYTLSAWVKFGNIGVDKTIWSCSTDTYIYISGAGVITCNFRRNGSTNYEYGSSKKLKDPTAWYHIVLRVDTTDSTDADKVQVYVNGVEDTPATTTYQNMADDYETGANVSGVEQRIGVYSDGSLDFDGYMCELMMVDNQSLAPTEFGEYDEDTPTIWKPKDISGISVGTNGYYLDFEDSSNLGNNAAGSGSADLTETNLAAADQATDSCTNNFCTMNPLTKTSATLSEGNLKQATAGNSSVATFGVSAGTWYFEQKILGGVNEAHLGFALDEAGIFSDAVTGSTVRGAGYVSLYSYDGKIYNESSATSSFATFAANDIVGFALDVDNGNVYLYQNGSALNSGNAVVSGKTGKTWFPFGNFDAGDVTGIEHNFGGCPSFSISSAQNDENGFGTFEFAPPSGYLSLCTKNLGSDGG